MPRTALEKQSDETLKRLVVEELYWDSRVDASKIEVHVEEGVVTLSGHVPTYTSRYSAEADARLISGVVAVENLLAVDRPQIVPDQELQDSVLMVLGWDAEVDSSDISIVAQEGMITLEGTVRYYWEKQRAERLVSGVNGVVGVTNRLAVVPTESVVDREIADEIVRSLKRRLYDAADTIDVAVESGVVTLRGTVPNWDAYSSAEDAAMFTRGVIEIDNQLTFRSSAAAP